MEEKEFLPDDIESSEKNNFKRFLSVRSLAILFFVFLFINVIYIDILLAQSSNKQTIVQRFTNIISQTPPAETKTPASPEICPQSCLLEIRQATISNKQTATPTSVPTVLPLQNATSSQAKEYYVPFGSGSGSSADWEDVPGLQASIDSNSYGSIKNVVFEASLHIPTGNETANVRLYNATDGHPVWNSEVDFNGNIESILKTSQLVNLDSGNKLYKVQIKTQLQFQAILDQSRLHIATN
jgi:hypothetical protein